MFGLFEWEDLETRLILFIINPECELEKKMAGKNYSFTSIWSKLQMRTSQLQLFQIWCNRNVPLNVQGWTAFNKSAPIVFL